MNFGGNSMFTKIMDFSMLQNGFLVYKLKKLWYCIGGRVKQKFGFIKRVNNVELPP